MTENGDRPELPAGWEWRTLGELCEKSQYGFTTKAAPSGELRFLRTTDIAHGPVNWSTVPFCADLPKDQAKYRLHPGDLVISRSGSVGLSALVEHPPNAVFASYLIRFRPKNEEIRPRFLAWYLQSPAYWAEVHRRASGIGMNNINAKKLAGIPVPVAPKAEQARIVESVEQTLGVLGPAREQLLSASGKLAPLEKSILDSALKSEPRVRLGDVVEVRSGYGFPKELQRRTAGEVPFMKVRDISRAWSAGSRWLSEADHYISNAEATSRRMKLFPSGTVVMAKIGEAVRLNRRSILRHAGLVDNNVMGWVPDKGRIDPDFLFLVSLTLPLAEMSRATTVPAIRTSEVAEIQVPVPSLDRQRALVARIGQQLAARIELAAAITVVEDAAARLERSVLANAFSGNFGTAGVAKG